MKLRLEGVDPSKEIDIDPEELLHCEIVLNNGKTIDIELFEREDSNWINISGSSGLEIRPIANNRIAISVRTYSYES